MRMLLTGTAGQVGSVLLPMLQPRATVLSTVRQELDLSRPGELASGRDDLQPDPIVDPASYTALDRAEEEPKLAFRVNVESAAAIAAWAAPPNPAASFLDGLRL